MKKSEKQERESRRSLPSPVHGYCFWVENQGQGLRTGVREAAPPVDMPRPLHARPQVSVAVEGGRHRNTAEALSPGRETVQDPERPACHGVFETMSKGDRDREVWRAVLHRAFPLTAHVNTTALRPKRTRAFPQVHIL